MNSQEYRNLQEAYLDVYGELDESAAGDVADKARKLANQKKGQTPERKKMYQDLEYKARYRDTYGDGSSHKKRSERTGTDRGISPMKSKERSSSYDIGGSTYTLSQKEKLPNSKEKYRRQVATGVRDVSAQERKRLGVKGVSRYNVKDLQGVKDSYEYDLYDVILEYLLNEGYANTQEAAEVMMVNMSEEWREEILDVYQELDENRMASRMEKMPTPPAKVGKATHSIKDLAPSKPPTPEEKAKARKALGLDERVLGQDPEMRRARTKDEKRLPPSAGTGYAANQKKSISYMNKLTKNNKIIPGMAHEEVEEFDEATAMSKRGLDEPEIRKEIASKTKGGSFADKATALAGRETYGDNKKKEGREKLARAQRGDFRNTTSSSPGLRGYGHQSSDPAVKAKQDARGAQRGRAALTPNERKQLNMEFDFYDLVLSHLLDEGYADTNENALVIMANMSEEWKNSIIG